MVGTYVAKYKRFPSPTDAATVPFDDIGWPGETAKKIDSAIRSGYRWLRHDDEYLNWLETLPAGVSPSLSALNGDRDARAGKRATKDNLTIAKIREMIAAFKERHGRYPKGSYKKSLSDSFDDLGYKGKNVNNVNAALRNGCLGLRRDPEYLELVAALPKGYILSLAKLTPEDDGLTISDIHEMVRRFVEVNGRPPSTHHKDIFELRDGTRQNVVNINSAIKTGGLGLNRDPEYDKWRRDLPPGVKPTLATLVSEKLTLRAVRDMIAAFQRKHNRFPVVDSRKDSFEDAGYPGRTAASVNQALRKASQYLECDPEYVAWRNSLPEGVCPTLASLNPNANISMVMTKAHRNDITFKAIHEIIDAFVNATGRFPSVDKKDAFDIVGFHGETAQSIDSVLRTGFRQLKQDSDYIAWRNNLPQGATPTMSLLNRCTGTPKISKKTDS